MIHKGSRRSSPAVGSPSHTHIPKPRRELQLTMMADLRASPPGVVFTLSQRPCKGLGVLLAATKYQGRFAVGVSGTPRHPKQQALGASKSSIGEIMYTSSFIIYIYIIFIQPTREDSYKANTYRYNLLCV